MSRELRVWHQLLHARSVGGEDLKITALIACRVATFTAVEVTLTALALDGFTVLREFHALSDRLVGFLFHSVGVSKTWMLGL